MESFISEELQKQVSKFMDMMWSEIGSTMLDFLCYKYEAELRNKLPDSGDCPVVKRKCILYAMLWEFTTLAANDQDMKEFLWGYFIKEHSKRDPDDIPSKESWKSSIEIYKPFRDQFSFNLFEMLMGSQTDWEKADGLLDYPRFRMDYDNLGKIGKGGCGTVYKVTNKLDGIRYALKLIPFCYGTKDEYKIIEREIRILAKLKPHPNLIAYKTSWSEKFVVNSKSSLSKAAGMAVPTPKTGHTSTEPAEALATTETSGESSTSSGSQQEPHQDLMMGLSLCILTELCGKNLKTWMEERIVELGKLASEDGRTKSLLDLIDANECLNILKQILIGVKVIHDNHVIHRDLKPENILLGLDGRWKVGDFGLATIDQCINKLDPSASSTQSVGKVHTVGLGTSSYAAPEQLKKDSGPYDHKVDMFSVGMLAFELFHPFKTVMEREKTFENLRYKQLLPKEFITSFPKVAELILKMTSTSPNKRPDAFEILESEMFSKDGHNETDDHSEELLILKMRLIEKDAELSKIQDEKGKLEIEIRKLMENFGILQDGLMELTRLTSSLTQKRSF